MELYYLTREDPETGEETTIELEVEVEEFSLGSAPHPLAVTDDPPRIGLGTIRRADTGEVFEPTEAELEDMARDLWKRYTEEQYE